MALHLFGTEDLDLKQLLELVDELKKPGVTPPGGLVAREPVTVMRDNVGTYTGTDKSRVYLSKGRIAIQFSDRATALGWAYRLMVKTGLPWEKALHKFKTENMNIVFFHQIWSEKRNLPGLCGLTPGSFELDHQLEQYLQRLTRQWQRNTTPYPDNTPLKRQYNSLSKGDKLVDDLGETWAVAATRPSLDGPPEIMLEKVEEVVGG